MAPKKRFLPSFQQKFMNVFDSVEKDLPTQRVTGSKNYLFNLSKKYFMITESQLKLAIIIYSGTSKAMEGLK